MKNLLTTPAALLLTTILLLGAHSSDGAGVTSAAELPGATLAAIEKASLDNLEGHAVELAPWAFAWPADAAVQDKPEAYFIPRRLERIDTVYRTALEQLGAAALKSLHYDMPDLDRKKGQAPRFRARSFFCGRFSGDDERGTMTLTRRLDRRRG